MSDGFVYFIQEEETGRIKIGFSEKHPNGRLKDFQTGNSNKLNLLGYIEGTYEDESNLHREFYEERGNGEWFEPSPRLNDRIKELLEESLEEKKSGIEDLNLEYNEEGNDLGYEKDRFKIIKKSDITWNWMEVWHERMNIDRISSFVWKEIMAYGTPKSVRKSVRIHKKGVVECGK